MKLTVSISEEALKLADEGAKRLCISRSAFITIAIVEKSDFEFYKSLVSPAAVRRVVTAAALAAEGDSAAATAVATASDAVSVLEELQSNRTSSSI